MKRFVLLAALLLGCGSSSATSPSDAGPGNDGDASSDADSRSDSATKNDDGGGDAGAPAIRYGATVEDGGVTFRVWAPHASAATVTGDFPEASMAMNAESPGVYSAHVASAHAGTHYRYVLATLGGALTRTDPWCRQVQADGTCIVVDPGSYTWATKTFAAPTRSNAVVYELHVGSFATDPSLGWGTFSTLKAKLAELADLGINVIELMPIHASSSNALGWGYTPQLWLAPKPALGSPDDLRALVDAAHGFGIGIWMDIVVNHSDRSSKAPLVCFDGDCGGAAGIYFFGPGSYATTPWGPRPDYSEPHVVDMLLGSVDQWLTEYHGDGFRWDSVSNVRAIDGAGTTPGGRDLLVRANSHIHDKGAFSVAEDLKGYGAITQPASAGGFGFDAQWDGFGYAIDAELVKASDDARDMGAVISALTGSSGGDPFARLLFTEDHDTVGNGGARLPSQIDAANPESWAAKKRSMLGAVMLLTTPGVPMLFMGQEQLATGTFTLPAAPLAAPTAAGTMVRSFYKDILRLRRNLDGGAGGLADPGIDVFHRNDTAKVVAYRRYGPSDQDVIVIVNLRNKAYTEYDIGVADAGPWRVRLNTESTAYASEFGSGQTGSITARLSTKDGKPYTLPLQLAPYSAMVLTH